MCCLQYKKVIICLKTEVCWFGKRTFNIVRPCLRCTISFYFIMIDLHSITLKDKTYISIQNNQCISTKYQQKLLNRPRNMAQK